MKTLVIFAIIIGFSQCSSLKLQDNPPFEIKSAVYENWTGGQAGVSGINVKIFYKTDKTIEFDSVYFRNRVSKLEPKKVKGNKIIVGYFNTSALKKDIILDENSSKEINNPIPEVKKIPFRLEENEAVISYKINGEQQFYKIKSLKEAKPVSFPSPSKQ